MIGQTLGHYRIVEQIGAGGMGVVYRAHDERLERDVALKVLPAESLQDTAARARLLREARTASQMNHPNICTIHDVGEADDHAYIAMELVEGQPLSVRLAGGPLAAEQVFRYGLQLADALAHAHDRGIVHRDLKSANVVITPEGRAKVLDFGLAKRLGSERPTDGATQSQATLTQPGAVVGTLAYMAPEQLRGQPADARSDVWALGMMLYEMASGTRPFHGQTGFELSSAILHQPPAPLPTMVPAGLKGIIERCLDKEPERRYQRGGELRAALEAIQAGAVVGEFPTGQRVPSARIDSLAVMPLENLSGDPEQAYLADGIHEALITELSKLSGLRRVIGRWSVVRYRAIDKPLPQIAQELGVESVITGSVLRSGDRVRITAHLFNAATEEHLWSERYDRELRDVLSLQNEIVTAIIREIRLQLTPQERAKLAGARPVNPEVYEAYLKGRFHWYKLSREELSTAERYFQLALQKDPGFALAHVGIADVWLARGDSGFVPPREALLKGGAAALQALELDDTLAEAHVALGNFRLLYEWNWSAGERELQRAIELDPNSANAHLMYSDFLISTQRIAEWALESRRALELDPLNFFYQCFYGWHLVYLHRYDEAIAQLRSVLEAQPEFSSAHLGLWGALYKKNLKAESMAEARKFFRVLGDQEVVEVLRAVSTAANYRGAMKCAAERFAARAQHSYIPAVRIARLYAHAGDNDCALNWLERAYERGETALFHLGVSWDWDDLRSEPRFQALLRRMNFPP